jgi:hypothetical protein
MLKILSVSVLAALSVSLPALAQSAQTRLVTRYDYVSGRDKLEATRNCHAKGRKYHAIFQGVIYLPDSDSWRCEYLVRVPASPSNTKQSSKCPLALPKR